MNMMSAESETNSDAETDVSAEFAYEESETESEIDPDEFDEYLEQWRTSEGFDVNIIPHGMPNTFIPYLTLDKIPELERQLADDSMKLAIDYYNKNENATFETVRLLRVNIHCVQGSLFYITFEAKDEDDLSEEFQAKVWWTVAGALSEERFKTEVLMCRKKLLCSYQSVQGN